MNREQAIREAFFNTLRDQLSVTIDGIVTNVPVYDSKVESSELIYVTFATQISLQYPNISMGSWRSTFELDIWHKQQNSITYDYVDAVADQIESLIPSYYPQQNGWEIINIQVNAITNMRLKAYQSSNIIANKNVQFTLIINKL